MSKKQTVVLFQDGKLPKIYVNPFSIDDLDRLGTVLINPKIPKKAPPHKWFPKDGKIMVNKDAVLPEFGSIPMPLVEKTGLELDSDIKHLDAKQDIKINQLLEIIKNKETIIIDKYKFLCNISILGFFILLFLTLYIDTIKQIFERL